MRGRVQVADVDCRVSGEGDEVGDLARRDRTDFRGEAEGLGGL